MTRSLDKVAIFTDTNASTIQLRNLKKEPQVVKPGWDDTGNDVVLKGEGTGFVYRSNDNSVLVFTKHVGTSTILSRRRPFTTEFVGEFRYMGY